MLVVVGVVDDVRGMRALVKLSFQVAAAIVAWWLGLSIELLHMPWGIVELGSCRCRSRSPGSWRDQCRQPDRRARRARVRGSPDRARRIRPARSRRRRRSDAAADRRHRRGGGRIPRLQPPPRLDHHGRHRLDVPRLRRGCHCDLADPGRGPPVSPWVPIVALGVPIVDTAWAIVRRTARGEPFFVADRGHIHHQLLRRGLSQRDAMLFFTAVLGGLGDHRGAARPGSTEGRASPTAGSRARPLAVVRKLSRYQPLSSPPSPNMRAISSRIASRLGMSR